MKKVFFVLVLLAAGAGLGWKFFWLEPTTATQHIETLAFAQNRFLPSVRSAQLQFDVHVISRYRSR